LRAIAALVVMVSHYSTASKWIKFLGDPAGVLGVMVFFILSGFLMSYLYMGKGFKAGEVKSFVVARVARVVPLFLLVVLFSYYLYLFGYGGVFFDITGPSDLFSHLFLLRGERELWTIPVELQFYVLFIFIWWLSSKSIFYSFFLMAVLFYLEYALGLPRYTGSFGVFEYDIRTFQCFHYFFAGVVFGWLYTKWTPAIRSGLFIVTLLIIPLLHPRIFPTVFKISLDDVRISMGVFIGISFIFFSILFLVGDDNKILSNKVGDFLGKISYSLYLLHHPIIMIIRHRAIEHPLIYFFVFFLVTIAVSTVSYLLIEKPFRKAIRGCRITME